MTEIEQLRADIKTLGDASKAAIRLGWVTTNNVDNILFEAMSKLRKLEAESVAVDPWAKAKKAAKIARQLLGSRDELDMALYVNHLEAELAKRPVVYIAKLPCGHRFMTYKEPQVFLSVENAKSWFATVPICDVEFEPYKGEQNSDTA